MPKSDTQLIVAEEEVSRLKKKIKKNQKLKVWLTLIKITLSEMY